MPIESTERNSGKFKAMRIAEQLDRSNESKEENPDWNRFWGYKPNLDDPHRFGECMEDWYDYD